MEWRVPVSDGCRGYKNGRPRRELDDEIPVPQNEVAALRVVVVAQGVDRAHAEYKIIVVPVQPGPYIPPEVECDSRENAEGEGAEEGGETESFDLLLDGRNHGVDEGEGFRRGECVRS